MIIKNKNYVYKSEAELVEALHSDDALIDFIEAHRMCADRVFSEIVSQFLGGAMVFDLGEILRDREEDRTWEEEQDRISDLIRASDEQDYREAKYRG